MNILLQIAHRYFFAKKTTQAINIISWISMIGIMIGTTALIIILSIFNGFEGLLTSLFSNVKPDLKVLPASGKYFEVDDSTYDLLNTIEGIDQISQTIEEVALFEYHDAQKAGRIKGVDIHYKDVIEIDEAIQIGKFSTHDSLVDMGVIGRGIANNLGIVVSDHLSSITAYMPIRRKKDVLQQMGKEYQTLHLYPAGTFTAGSDDDLEYIITNIQAVRSLLQLPKSCSALEVKLLPEANEKDIRLKIKHVLPESSIQNRYEQDAEYLRIMNVEKLVSFLIAALVLVVITFNMVGALWMLVLEKKQDLSILQSMGLTARKIGVIIWIEGMIITTIGLISGIILALIFYYLQVNYGIIGVPEGFIMDAYPIKIKGTDFILVILTVLVIGGLASLLPAYRASKISAFIRQE